MGEENLVVFKGNADGITVVLDEYAAFKDVMRHFKEKLNESKVFFKGSKVSIRFKGRLLTQEEQDELMEVLKKQNIINISFVHPFDNETATVDHEMQRALQELSTFNGSLTHFHYGIVRSGVEIEYPGNVIVFGDINPGGVIKANGNVIVFGAIKGKVHAGLELHFPNPFIICKSMAPIQLGIQNVIAPWPEQEKIATDIFRIAYLLEEQLYIDVLDQKSINHMLSRNDKQGV